MIGLYDELLEAAVLAPSGDNTQPWRFVLNPEEEGLIAIEVDSTRDPSPMNAGQRMARLALGAALENLLRAARFRGWDAVLEPPSPPAIAAVRLTKGPDAAEDSGKGLDDLANRVTNRRLYDGRPLPTEVLDALKAIEPLGSARLLWINDRERLDEWARLIGRADALMFGEPSMRRAFLQNVRFDAPAGQRVTEGLSLDSLEPTRSDRLALPLLPKIPDWLFQALGLRRVFATKARQLVASASGLGLVVAEDRDEVTDLAVGRLFQRAWLAISDRGLVAQPMMSLAVLDNAMEHGSLALIASLKRGRVEALLAKARDLAPEIEDGRLAFLLRFGYAEPPQGRTGRRAWSEVTVGPPDLAS